MRTFVLVAVCLLPLLAVSATKKAVHKTSTHKASTKKASTKKTALKSRKRRSKTAQTWRNRQQAPSPQRYKEIQQALADKGYLKATPSGVWDSESVEALRRFQQDQNLESSGKLDSISLIALGLGPKRDAPAVTSPNARP